MFQINQRSVSKPTTEELQDLQRQFETQHCAILNNIISPQMQPLIQRMITGASYQSHVHEAKSSFVIGKEFVIDPQNMLYNLFFVLMNTNDFMDTIRSITQTPQIQSFQGRFYKLDNSENCFDNWHDDIQPSEGRLVGMSLNLSEFPYEGGHFKIKNKSSKEVFREVSYKDWGTAHIFRIDPALHHKVEAVTGEQPRIAYAGWFFSEKNVKDYLTIQQ